VGAKGRNMLLYIGDDTSPGNFTLVAGLQSSGLSISNTPIDVTNIDSEEHRELLDGGHGNRTYSISGSGVFKDDAVIRQIEDAVQAAALLECQMVFENGDFYQGFFAATSFSKTADHTSTLLYSISLESASKPQFSRATAAQLLYGCAISWASVTHPGSNVGQQRAHFNGDSANPFYLLAGGSGSAGSIAWSLTGTGDFTLGSVNASQYVICLAYDSFNAKWIAGGWSNSLENSSDGKTFTSRAHPRFGNKNNIACNSSGRCIVVSDQSPNTYFEISDDGGDTWYISSQVLSITSVFRGIATDDNGTWLASRNNAVYKSVNDGIDWALSGTAAAGAVDRDIVWASELGLWVFIVGQYIYTSPDGVTWTERYNTISGGWNFLRLAYSTGGCLVAVGFSGNAVQSTDAINWTPISIGGVLNFGGVLVSYDKWLVSTESTIYNGT